MENKWMTEEELNNVSKEMIVKLYLQMADSFEALNNQLEALTSQNEALNKNLVRMQEQLAILAMQKFGRKTEQSSAFSSGQLSFADIMPDMKDVFNEAEATANGNVPEPELEAIIYKRKKRTGKRNQDLSELEVVVEDAVTISEEELKEKFPYGYTRLPDEVYRELEYIPAKFLVHEVQIAVYTGKNDTGKVKAQRPERLLKNSILSPSLAAGVMESKYVNHIPLNRLSEDFRRKDVDISKQVLAGWMIKIADRYLQVVYNHMHKKILGSKLVHCDETPFKVIANGMGANSKDYMRVYHSCEDYGSPPIYVYDYQDGKRNTAVLKDFLGDYK